jgi:transposase
VPDGRPEAPSMSWDEPLSAGQGSTPGGWPATGIEGLDAAASGERGQAIGRSRGGRTTKIHALIDLAGRPLAFRLTPLLCDTAPSTWLIGDKVYDADHVRALLESRGTLAVIPNKANRQRLFPFDAERYKWRNVIERTNCRIKDFRAIATRYDKLARNFLAGLCLVTALIYWCN